MTVAVIYDGYAYYDAGPYTGGCEYLRRLHDGGDPEWNQERGVPVSAAHAPQAVIDGFAEQTIYVIRRERERGAPW